MSWKSACFVTLVVAVHQVFSLREVSIDNLEKDGPRRMARLKRQEHDDDEFDRWVWGYVNIPVNVHKDTHIAQPLLQRQASEPPSTEAPRINEEENPCYRLLPSMPDFNAPGRRISQTKCFEYIWMVKHRLDEAKKSDDCVNYTIRHKSNDDQFAIGGRNTDFGEFPHMGAIGWKAVTGTWIFKCGSTLISSKFVLTAAHCSKASPRDTTIADIDPKIVRLGEKNIIDIRYLGRLPINAKITKIIVHPSYNSPNKYYDIALMELDRHIKFSLIVQPACIWSSFDTSSLGIAATATGWGVLETNGLKNSPNLQVVDLDLIDSQICDRLLTPKRNRLWGGIEDHQMCAGKLEGGVDTCKGDSGGPLQVKIPLPTTAEGAMHYVIGVTSFGFGCANADTPAVYTRVSSFVDWIEDIVWR